MTSEHLDDDRSIAYALGEVEPSERQLLEDHLRVCGTCGAQVEELARLLETERTARRRAVPVHVLVSLLGRQAAARRRSAARRFLAPGIAAAGLAALLFGAGYLQGRRTSPGVVPAGGEASRSQERHVPLVAPAPDAIPFETAVAAASDLTSLASGDGARTRAAGDSTTFADSL